MAEHKGGHGPGCRGLVPPQVKDVSARRVPQVCNAGPLLVVWNVVGVQCTEGKRGEVKPFR